MKSFNDLSLQVKFAIITALLLSVVFAMLITVIYYNQKDRIIKDGDERFFSHLSDLVSIIDEQRKGQEEKANIAMLLAEQAIKARGGIREQDSVVIIPNGGEIVATKAWYMGQQLIQTDTSFVDNFYDQTGCMLGIIQKTNTGYISLIASDIPQNKKMNRFGIPMTHKPLTDALNSNSPFVGTTVGAASKKMYSLASKRIESSANAFIFTSYLLDGEATIQKNIIQKKYLQNGYPYIAAKDGVILFHPIAENIGTNLKILTPNLYQQTVDKTDGLHKIFATDQFGNPTYQYCTYYAPYDVFVFLLVTEEDLLGKSLNSLKVLLISGAVGAIILCNILLGFAAVFYSGKPIKQILGKINRLAQGKSLEIVEITQHDDFGQILSAVNQLTMRLNNASHFAKEVGKGNFGTTYTALHKEDDLGNALLEMRDDLKEAHEKEVERRWLAEGIAKFNEIIRLHTSHIHELSYEVLAELIKYVNANQGAIFLVDTDDSKMPCLELSACYAYKRRKYAQKRIYLGDGLVGQTWQEGEEIYLKKVPEEYAKIGSGLGEAPPSCLFLVPLKFNGEIQGVLEIASFQQFTSIEKEFILKIIESLSAAVSVARFSENTKKLLQESQYMMENLRSQEEEMRQNYEELQATQEELFRREQESKEEKEALISKINILQKEKIDQ